MTITVTRTDKLLNRIVHMDALELPQNLPKESVDLIVTDPPYAAGRLVSVRRTPSERFDEIKGNETIQTEWIAEAYRVLKQDTAIYMFATWRNIGDWQRLLADAGFNVKNCIVWDKMNHGLGDLAGGYAFQHEFIVFGSKGRHILRGERPKDIIRMMRLQSDQLIHPYEKPVGLLEWLIRNSSDSGALVVDPFAGSGATAAAARNLDRHYIGCDIDAEYVEAANRRLRKPWQQGLF